MGTKLVGWSLTSLFSTNTAISETKIGTNHTIQAILWTKSRSLNFRWRIQGGRKMRPLRIDCQHL